jgi:hypothetical protein
VGAPRHRPSPQLSPQLILSLAHTPTHLSTASCSSPRSCAFPRRAVVPYFFCPRVEEEVASTTQDQSGNSGSTAEHHDGPCSSSRSLSEVMSCSSFFSLGGGRGRNALETMDTAHHLHMLILPSLSLSSLSTHELIAQARPHRARRRPPPPRASLL